MIELFYNLSDPVMFVVVTVATLTCIFYATRKHNFVIAAMILPLFVQSAYYLLLSLDFEPIESSPALRVAVVRPAQFILFVILTVFFANGMVNKAISRTIKILCKIIGKILPFRRAGPRG